MPDEVVKKLRLPTQWLPRFPSNNAFVGLGRFYIYLEEMLL